MSYILALALQCPDVTCSQSSYGPASCHPLSLYILPIVYILPPASCSYTVPPYLTTSPMSTPWLLPYNVLILRPPQCLTTLPLAFRFAFTSSKLSCLLRLIFPRHHDVLTIVLYSASWLLLYTVPPHHDLSSDPASCLPLCLYVFPNVLHSTSCLLPYTVPPHLTLPHVLHPGSMT
jgi:hypothetical protein